MDNTTERLADFAAEMRFDLLSDETVHECKRRLIDTVASAMAGYGDPVCRMARGMAKKRPSEPAASIWGSNFSAAPEMAAFANGVMLRFMDISDTYVGKSRGCWRYATCTHPAWRQHCGGLFQTPMAA